MAQTAIKPAVFEAAKCS